MKTPGGDEELRTSTLIRHRPIQGDSHIDFLGESEGSLQPLHDSFLEAISVLVVRVRKFHKPPSRWSRSRREKNHSHVKNDVSRTTCTNLDVKQEKRIEDYWNIEGSRELFDSYFTQFTLLEEKFPNGYLWFRSRLTESSQHPRRIIYVQNSSRNWEEMPNWRRDKRMKIKVPWCQKITRNLCRWPRGDKEFKKTIKNARAKMFVKNWKRRQFVLCFARQVRSVSMGRFVIKPMSSNQNLRVFWKPVSPQDCVWKNISRIFLRTILQERVTILINVIIRSQFFL